MPRKTAKTGKRPGPRQDPIVLRFSERLREMRRARGLSQHDLARSAGVDPAYVGRLERGERAPGIDLVERLARALGAAAGEMLPSSPGDPEAVVREQARRRFESILKKADRETLLLLLPVMALVDDALDRGR
jgi:transcriptional regulator with XRE-family HTH domain